jgi:Flp pilus assembly protein TadD
MQGGQSTLLPEGRIPGRASVAGALCVLLLICYGGTSAAPLLLDDEFTLNRNPSVHRLSDVGRVLSPPAHVPTGGRPFANASFALSYAVSGSEPWGHRLGNILLHGAVSLVLFGVVRRTLSLPSMPVRVRGRAREIGASICLIWAVHPLLTQCVTYISQRTEVQMAGCYLLTLYGFIRAEAEPAYARGWRLLSIMACWAGSLSKEPIATAPLMVMLFHWIFFGVGLRELRGRYLRYYGCLAASWLILALSLRGIEQRGISYGAGVKALDYATVQVQAVMEYLRLCFWPNPLIFDRSPLVVLDPHFSLPHGLVLALLLAAVGWGLWRRSRWAFLGAWFFGILAPTSSVIPVVNAAVAENRVYLPSVVVVAGLVVALCLLLPPLWARIACVALGVSAAWGTHSRNLDYSDAITLWSDTVEKAPANPRAHAHLAHAYQRAGLDDAALRHFREAARLDCALAAPAMGIGIILANRPGQAQEAILHLTEAVLLDPFGAEAHANLGAVLGREGKDPAMAERHLRESLRLAPHDAGAWFLYGEFAERRRGDFSEARRAYGESLRLRPGFEPAAQALSRLTALPARHGGASSFPSLP